MKLPSKGFLVAVAAIAVVAVLYTPNFVRARGTSASAPCINNLRNLDSGKQQWALENGVTNGARLRMENIRPYLSRDFQCPAGGTYYLGRIGEDPTCSLGGPKHKLPQ